jgi:hypothetical protein
MADKISDFLPDLNATYVNNQKINHVMNTAADVFVAYDTINKGAKDWAYRHGDCGS